MYYGDLYKIAATIISGIAKISPLKVLAVTSRPLPSKNSIVMESWVGAQFR